MALSLKNVNNSKYEQQHTVFSLRQEDIPWSHVLEFLEIQVSLDPVNIGVLAKHGPHAEHLKKEILHPTEYSQTKEISLEGLLYFLLIGF